MTDFVYDQHSGKPVAFIKDGQVFRDGDGKLIGAVRAGNIYDLQGNLVGHLAGLHVEGLRTNELPVSFRRLLDS